jgi:2-oxo-3-hexenedioate decarboxylase
VNHREAALRLHTARQERREVPMLSRAHPDMGLADAYRVQAEGIELRKAEGERVVGGKLGFTSRAMQQAMGVHHPNYGWLTDAMLVHDGLVALDRLIHPKVEPEIAFLLAEDLRPPVRAADVLAATAGVMACLEVVDSRYEGFRFGPLDNVADDSSAGLVAFGDPLAPAGLDLARLGVVVTVDGSVRHTAAGAAALDHPAVAVAWMANHADAPLQAGQVVISGGLTAPVDLHPGTVVEAEFDRIGSVMLRAA